MDWQKLGLVYGLDGSSGWARHSALQPTPLVLQDRIRVFCGFRDDHGVSRIGYVDVSRTDPTKVLEVSQYPVLERGEFGTFDQDGVVPCAVIPKGDEIHMYYAGYLRGEKVRFQVFSGVAISHDNGRTFTRRSNIPILDRTPGESLFRVIHTILWDNGRWRVWYGAGDTFIAGREKSLPVYNIRYMESADGFDFPRQGELAIDILDGEHRVGRPYVIKVGERYLMFFGRGKEDDPYRLAYAESSDGLAWTQHQTLSGLELSSEGWDSEMMAYPAVVTTNSGTYMFYNGNNYGRDGFGCARLLSW